MCVCGIRGEGAVETYASGGPAGGQPFTKGCQIGFHSDHDGPLARHGHKLRGQGRQSRFGKNFLGHRRPIFLAHLTHRWRSGESLPRLTLPEAKLLKRLTNSYFDLTPQSKANAMYPEERGVHRIRNLLSRWHTSPPEARFLPPLIREVLFFIPCGRPLTSPLP